MTCRAVDREEVIPKYLNGQLEPAAQDDFEVHILECPDCRDAVNLFQSVREQLEVRAHEIRSYHVARTSRWWSWAAVGACSVIAVAIGIRQIVAYQHPKPQTAHQQISTPGALSRPEVQTAGGNSGSSPSVLAGQQPTGTGSGNPPMAPANARGGVSAPSGDPAAIKMQRPDYSPARSGAGRAGAETQLASAGKDAMSANPSRVGASGTPDQQKVPPTGSLGNSTPERDSTANPVGAVARNATSPSGPVADEMAQLAAVRPLPYSFSGLAASQPTGGGSTKGSRSSTSAVSGTAGTPQPGTGAFSTTQDYFRDGMTAYVEHRYEAATVLLGQAVRMDPQFGEANLYLGICFLLQGNATDAVSPLQSASREKKPATTQAAHFYLAKAYLKLGRLADAEAELRAATAIPGRVAGEANALIQRLQAIQHPDMHQ